MKAWMLHNANDIRFEQVEKPVINENEVLVKVRAAGICGSDISRVYRDGAHVMPLIPGHEFAGEVVETSSEKDKSLVGKRVGVFPLIPCMECPACKNKRYEMCHEYSYLGSRTDGGFAEYVAVPRWNIIELPDNVSYEAAAMLEPMAVAVHAINRMDIYKLTDKLRDDSMYNSSGNDLAGVSNTTALVIGLGTIGLLITMFLVEKGITDIFVVGNKENQKNIIEKMMKNINALESTELAESDDSVASVNYTDSKKRSVSRIIYCDASDDIANVIKTNTNKTGADIVFECVGKSETINQAISLAGDGSRVCTVGNPHSDIILDRNAYWHILRKQIKLTGTWNSSFLGNEGNHGNDANDVKYVINGNNEAYWEKNEDDWRYVLKCLSDKSVKPEMIISHKLSLEELEQGLLIMRDKKEDYIKIMCIM